MVAALLLRDDDDATATQSPSVPSASLEYLALVVGNRLAFFGASLGGALADRAGTSGHSGGMDHSGHVLRARQALHARRHAGVVRTVSSLSGTLYDEVGRGVFGPPPSHAGRVWRSTDGTEWTDASPRPATFADVELVHLFEATDGALIVIGAGLRPRGRPGERRVGDARRRDVDAHRARGDHRRCIRARR